MNRICCTSEGITPVWLQAKCLQLFYLLTPFEMLYRLTEIATIQREKEGKEYRAKRISLFMRMLARQEECLEFDPAVFTTFAEKVVVSGTKKDVRLKFVLRDGREYWD